MQGTFGNVLKAYFLDSPNLIPLSEMPCIYVEPITTEIDVADTGRDQWTYTIDVGIVIDAKQELLKYKKEMVGTRYLTELMEARTDAGVLKPNTILYILRHNLTLGSNWMIGNISSVDYSLRIRGTAPDTFVTKEAKCRLTIIQMTNRE